MNCTQYRVYDWFKQTWLGSLLFYSGHRFIHFKKILWIAGTVVDCHHSTDGDISFDLKTDGDESPYQSRVILWHCEVTPCQPQSVKEMAQSLKAGDKVEVLGRVTFDPPHHILWKKFTGGGWELHPVLAIKHI